MKIRAHYDPKPIPDRRFDWTATDEDTYDGAPDSGTRGLEITQDLIRARLDKPLAGAEAWDNCIHWEAQGETLADFALDCEEIAER